jgi:hypothetical protein
MAGDENEWVRVPRESTDAMHQAYTRAKYEGPQPVLISDLWTAMLDAAPTPEDGRGDAVRFYAACQRACKELPIGWEIRVCLENGAGTVELIDPDGNGEPMDVDADHRLTAEVRAATDHALAQAERQGES